MIKVGIIGCGKIADAHAEQISRIQGCKIIGVCDAEELMAKQLSERYNVGYYCNDVNSFLEVGRPDIVHITTPPQSHFALGKICLEAGCHIYIEKPFTVITQEAEELVKLANQRGLKITVGHDNQFTHAARRMRELIKGGYLGGKPVHMESYYCYDLGDRSYAMALLGNKDHWVRTLPGGLLHNIISHGISKIAEFVTDDNAKIIAHAFCSSFLRSISESDILDELRVIISTSDDITAYFTFSSQMRPALHQFRIYGPKNGLMVDHDHQILIKLEGVRYKSYLDKFLPPYIYGKQYMANSLTNINRFLRKDFHMNSGMRFLIRSFYRSVTTETDPPIPYREILLTCRLMDSIFAQLKASN